MRYLGQIQTKSVGVVRFSLWLFVLQGVPHKNAAKDSAFGEMQPDNRVKGFVVDLALFISCVQLLNLSLYTVLYFVFLHQSPTLMHTV